MRKSQSRVRFGGFSEQQPGEKEVLTSMCSSLDGPSYCMHDLSYVTSEHTIRVSTCEVEACLKPEYLYQHAGHLFTHGLHYFPIHIDAILCRLGV